MSLFLFLTVVQAIVAAALVGVILMQRSEGGGLGMGGSPSGLMSARGASDFLTRATKWLAIAFVVLSIAMAAVAVETTSGDAITSTLDRSVAAEPDPLAGQAGENPAPAGAAVPAAPAPAATVPANDPLSGATE
ncbi:preprotein translocase subunit SecG [Altererythrobacter confluentis]|uniref:Protein-export membrane protein SecG n=1 Tax=Allopontixanthobacter confluentis TaxID=1849021 RepID=A0A6L7GDP0_9SPHN|nr:preprotein translocase subunit SecG [Allopontixanthobacter confluentis]MXP14192.1 preprotein translocase subunit SecG [Allopontixanthobacter confluentis]